ncbi:hypothetical protein J4771_07065 [Candidatus Kaistella beijingensis]|uniref:discoidin domain-containing protein n=1 Tax=Candidatus Kaistella beijingensis TaxID=2820270 RepID=UPI001CC4067B|nr:discoidin domain-containing protein [Candidatus Kaistella beijingensis]UBB88642.1 hypothetical protein J4771_07065 [Candidatus Kaistella beijingensis]
MINFRSNNNKDFVKVATVENTVDPKNTEPTIRDFSAEILPTEARFVKVVAKNFGKLPEWHQGFGGDAFIFVDEIMVK